LTSPCCSQADESAKRTGLAWAWKGSQDALPPQCDGPLQGFCLARHTRLCKQSLFAQLLSTAASAAGRMNRVRQLVARGVCAAVRPSLSAQQACACARPADLHTGELAIWAAASRPSCPGRGFAAAAAVQTRAAAASGAAELAAEPGAPGGHSAAAARPNKNRNHARRMLLRQKQIRVRRNLPG